MPRRAAGGKAIAGCVLVLAAAGATRGEAQSTYRLANGRSAVLQTAAGFVDGDFGEARVGVTVLYPFGGGRLGAAVSAAAGARAEQWDMFAGMDWVPGLEASARWHATLRATGRSRTVAWLSGGYRSIQRKTAAFVDDTSTVIRTDESTQHDVVAGVGLHQQFGPTVLAGISGTLSREIGSPGRAWPTEVCVGAQRSATDYFPPVCNDRYLGVLGDRWAAHVRGDVLVGLRRLSSRGIGATVALVGAGSLDLGGDGPSVLNVGIGPAIASARYPGQVVVAVLIEVRDIMEANDAIPTEFVDRLGLDPREFVPTFADRLGFRVAFSVPFPVFAQNF